MRKYLLALLIPFLCLAQTGRSETIKGSDSRITYIGRTEVNEGTVSFDWTGVYFKARFQGSSISMKVSDSHKNYYNVWLDTSMDKKPDKVLAVHGSDTTITIFSVDELKSRFGKDRKALRAPHQVILQKRTEGSQGRTTIIELETDGVFLQADKPSDRVMEFIGDSYTCGYGTEASNKERFSPETENQNLTYACMTARYFQAERIVIAHSGMGIVRNYNSNSKGTYMPDYYLRTFNMDPETKWDAGACSLKPNVSVIYLGTNDFSTGLQPSERSFVNNYIRLLQEIKANYGEEHPILCISPKHDPLQEVYIRKAIETSGLRMVYFLPLSHSVHNEVSDMGADGHPNGAGHQKLAYTVIPVISTITGWEMSSDMIN